MKLEYLLSPVCAIASIGAFPHNAAAKECSLAFDPANYKIETLHAAGREFRIRAYEGIVYVANPVDAAYECLNFYVPEEYYEGKSVNGYTAASAPIFFPNSVGGYMPGMPGMPRADDKSGPDGPPPMNGNPPPNAPNFGDNPPPGGMPPPGMADGGTPPGMPANGIPPPGDLRGRDGKPPMRGNHDERWPDTIAEALAHGYVVAAPGARGRTQKNDKGVFYGKAPACIVDLKAAVRYLRFNDKAMPGDAEKIVSNGTSAGGALSALLGASGNSPDYEPYLRAIGAAQARDDIFAASCYCPITNLEHADAAYEWLFCGINTYNGGKGTLDASAAGLSDQLKKQFPPYLNSLGLKAPDGTPLTLDADGNGSFADYVKSYVISSTQSALDSGKDLSGLDWVTIQNGKVVAIDIHRFAAFATRMKTPPAFDSLSLSSPENSLFGTDSIDTEHFTEFAAANSADHRMADAAPVRMMNAMNYVGDKTATYAPHWRIRHGLVDRDTSLAVPILLATKLEKSGRKVDFALPWGRGHAGDYDLDELFAWIDRIAK